MIRPRAKSRQIGEVVTLFPFAAFLLSCWPFLKTCSHVLTKGSRIYVRAIFFRRLKHISVDLRIGGFQVMGQLGVFLRDQEYSTAPHERRPQAKTRGPRDLFPACAASRRYPAVSRVSYYQRGTTGFVCQKNGMSG